ncbi:MAG: hypothetical protein QXV64_01490 [Candidatus Anstonellaceae archaeon]
MNIIAHRGYWKKNKEQNKKESIFRAIENGWGVETDIREYRGDIVISHDPIKKEKIVKLKEILIELEQVGLLKRSLFAFNVKCDGLEPFLLKLMKEYPFPKKFFFFDMSIPSLVNYIKIFEKNNLATRMSDIEKTAILLNKCSWLWIDSIYKNFSEFSNIEHRKNICFVSPELHHRKPKQFWIRIKKYVKKIKNQERVYICTDYPNQAEEYFKK